MEHSFKATQMENYALREYVIHLQSRLLDAQGEFPQPPPNLNLSQPPQAVASSSADPTPAVTGVSGTSLEAVAQAVAGLQESERLSDARFAPKSEAARTDEELKRQLEQDGNHAPAAPM